MCPGAPMWTPLPRSLGPLALTVLLGALPRVAHAAPPPPLDGTSPAPPERGLHQAAVAGPMDEQSEFEKGRNAYRAQKYDEADGRFAQMLDPRNGTLHDKVIIRQARMYWAATQLALHHDEDATSQFEIILTEDREYEPDPLAFPTEVVNAFIDTRAKLREKLEAIQQEAYKRAIERKAREEAAKQKDAQRLRMLERLAGEALVTEKHSRWSAAIPFGTGQFHNGQRTLGWFFLGAETALLAGVLTTLPLYYAALSSSKDTYTRYTQSVAQQYLDRANEVRDVNLVLNGVLFLTAIAGAVQAEVAYVPEYTRLKPRAVPDVPAAAPTTPPPATPPTVSFSFRGGPVGGPDGRGIKGGTIGLAAQF